MKLVNLTPHDVVIIRPEDGNLVIRPSGIVARANFTRRVVGDFDGVPVIRTEYGGVKDLPEPKPNTAYIVSSIAARAAVGREDLVTPEDLVRDENGVVVGCMSFAVTYVSCPGGTDPE